MWFLILLVVLLAVTAAYVMVRDRRHPVDHPPKIDGQGWGNVWPR